MNKLLWSAGLSLIIGLGTSVTPVAAEPRCKVVRVDETQAATRPAHLRAAQPALLYLNRCIGGATFSPGFENSRTNTSSIISSPGTLSEFPLDDAAWNQVVAETRDILAAYDLVVTDVDPGDQPHHEVAVCGSADQIGFNPDEVGGVSPLRCRPIENSIAYVFPPSYGDKTRRMAETVAHEAGHSFGLEHEFLCDEIMSYQDCYPQYFQDYDSRCGTYDPVDCSCARFLQNSHQFLLQAFGPGPVTPPQITITAPAPGESVAPGFWVLAEIDDTETIAWAKLVIDGRESDVVTDPPYYFKSPNDLGEGRHHLEVSAQDRPGAMSSATMDIVVGTACAAGGCGAGQLCLAGRCVLGPGSAGGLGEPCRAGECASGYCGVNGDGAQQCSEFCVVGETTCPAGFSCQVDSELGGACWARKRAPATGCQATPAPRAVLALVLITWLALARRRRRRA